VFYAERVVVAFERLHTSTDTVHGTVQCMDVKLFVGWKNLGLIGEKSFRFLGF